MANYAETESRLKIVQATATPAAVAAEPTAARALGRLRTFLVRRRTFLAIVIAGGLVVAAEPRPALLCMGLALLAGAHVLRVLCAGYLDKDNTLATNGPFAWCRNPLYIANMLVVVAFGLMSGRLEVLPVLLLLWYATHVPTVAREEQFLRGKFGAEFDRYCERVPRWWPRRPGCAQGGFSWARVIANDEHLNIISAWVLAAMFLIEMVR
ncbi:MAG: isoprenylcysteine carboxylmethyltransferase family protein [Armatimonadota bacterium]